MNAPVRMASASANYYLACYGVTVDRVHWMAACCCRDPNRSTGNANWMLGISTVVFTCEVPQSASVLIEGCAVWVSGVETC